MFVRLTAAALTLALIGACAPTTTSTQTAAQPAPNRAKEHVCDSMGSLAGSIMKFRQAGGSRARALEIAQRNPNRSPAANKIAVKMVETAYVRPVASGAAAKQTEINTFSKQWADGCWRSKLGQGN